MTASPISLKEMRTLHMKPRVRLMRRVVAVFVVLEVLLLVVLSLAFSASAHAEDRVKGDITVATDGGFARLIFHFEQEDPVTIRAGFPIMVLTFQKPVDVSVAKLVAEAKDYIGAARIDPDGTSIRIALVQKVKVNTMPAAEQLFVDLLPETWSGLLPGLPQEVVADLARRAQTAERQLHVQQKKDRETTPTIRVRVATQPTFVRFVFDLPVGINAVPDQHDGKFVLNFDRLIKWDLADAIASMPPTLQSIQADMGYDSVAINFVLNGTPKVRSFHEDRSIVVDVGLDGAPEKQADAVPPSGTPASPATPLPAIAPPDTVPAANPADQGKPAPAAPAPPPAPPPEKGAGKLPMAPAELPQIGSKDAPTVPAAPMGVAPPPPPAASASEPKAAPPAEPKSAESKPEDKPAAAAMPLAPAPKLEAEAPPAPAPKLEAAAPPQPAPKPDAASPPPAAPDAAAVPLPQAAPKAAKTGLAPNPKAPVKAELHKASGSMRIEFPFTVATPAAVFRRGDMLWLVFDSEATVDLDELKRDHDAIREAHFDREDGAAIVRLKLARPRLTGVLNDGTAWIVDVGDSVIAPTKRLTIARSIAGKNRASIAIPFDRPRTLHHIIDPAVGDKLMVVTALAPARGFLKEQDFVELRALPSVLGVVLQPFADDLTAELSVDKITVSRPLGLALSPTAIGQQQIAPSFHAMTFDTQIWGYDRSAEFNKRQSDLIHDAAMAAPQKRRAARLNLARFYLARNMSAEALAVLGVTLADERGADDITGTVLKSIADVMFDRPDEALKALSNPQIGESARCRGLARGRLCTAGQMGRGARPFQGHRRSPRHAADRVAAFGLALFVARRDRGP